MLKKFLAVSLTVFMVLAVASFASAKPYVYADYDGDAVADTSITILPGDTFTLDFYVTGLLEILPTAAGGMIETGNLLSFGTNIYFNQDFAGSGVETFDPAQVSADSAIVDSSFWAEGQTVNINPYNALAATPSERMAHVFLQGGVPAPGILEDQLLLGSIVFQCEGPGISIIDIAKPNAGGWLTSESINVQNFIDWDTYDVTVNQVPIPSAVLLLGSGLLGLLGFKRGRKK